MSKERELLKEFIDFVDSYEFYPTERNIIWEIVSRANAILAQPEPFKPDWDNYKQGVADSKREPLSESRIAAIWDDSDKTDVAITRAIEKAHGIEEDDHR